MRNDRHCDIEATDETDSRDTCVEPPVLLHFSAQWSRASRRMSPLLDEVAQVYKDRLRFRRIDVDEDRPIAEHFGIEQIPALVLLHGGQAVDCAIGVASRRQIATFLEAYV